MYACMDVWVDGQMDGRTDRQTEGRTDERKNGSHTTRTRKTCVANIYVRSSDSDILGFKLPNS